MLKVCDHWVLGFLGTVVFSVGLGEFYDYPETGDTTKKHIVGLFCNPGVWPLEENRYTLIWFEANNPQLGFATGFRHKSASFGPIRFLDLDNLLYPTRNTKP